MSGAGRVEGERPAHVRRRVPTGEELRESSHVRNYSTKDKGWRSNSYNVIHNDKGQFG